MLDIKFIKENPDLIREAARKKLVKFDVDELLKVEEKRLAALLAVEGLRAEQNRASDEVGKGIEASVREQLVSEMKLLKEQLKLKEEELKEIMTTWQLLMLQVPNVPDMTVPEGMSDADNKEVKKWGKIPEFNFKPKNHIDLMQQNGMVDFERGVKVAGFRGYFLKGDGALLAFAVWQYAQKFFLTRDFMPIIAPSLVRREVFLGTGYIPQGEEDLYKTQDGDFLAGTAEVGVMGYHMDEVIDRKELPKKYLGFSPCFRREAGSHGKDTKGLIRVHEFYKWEQVILCEASHEESVKWHEWVNRNTEEFVESLQIPYHTVANCGGDLGLGQVKKYDIELWVPGENKYREISSASYFHDFQTRRLNIKYKDEGGKMRFAHSLNSTAIPTPRILVSIIENFQNEDGSITIPEPLRPFFGKDTINNIIR